MTKPPMLPFGNSPGSAGTQFYARCGCCGNITDYPYESLWLDVKRRLKSEGWEDLRGRLGWVCPRCMEKYQPPEPQ